MSREPVIRYADSGGLQIAYQLIGDGPLDIVTLWDTATHLDLMWENPQARALLESIGAWGRVINVDVRGAGLSDPVEQPPTLEEWAGDLRAVVAAAGATLPAFIGMGQGAQLALLYAAMYPNGTAAVVSVNGYARLRRDADYACGVTPATEALICEWIRTRWGSGDVVGTLCPDWGRTPHDRAFLARMERASATPRRAAMRQELAFAMDIRDVLPTIRVPVLVVQADGDVYVRPPHAEYLAAHIPGAVHLPLAGTDHTPVFQDQDRYEEAVEEFLTGSSHHRSTNRSLMTVAFTDIVDSTHRAASLGDRTWRRLLETHESVSRREVERAGGRVVKFTGDGLLATFDGPARAVRCLQSLGGELADAELPIRAGVHTGEVETIGDDIGGLAVHIASRVSAKAGAGEVLVSSTVRDLVAGSGLAFEDRGEHELKGVPGAWRLLAVV